MTAWKDAILFVENLEKNLHNFFASDFGYFSSYTRADVEVLSEWWHILHEKIAEYCLASSHHRHKCYDDIIAYNLTNAVTISRP